MASTNVPTYVGRCTVKLYACEHIKSRLKSSSEATDCALLVTVTFIEMDPESMMSIFRRSLGGAAEVIHRFKEISGLRGADQLADEILRAK